MAAVVAAVISPRRELSGLYEFWVQDPHGSRHGQIVFTPTVFVFGRHTKTQFRWDFGGT